MQEKSQEEPKDGPKEGLDAPSSKGIPRAKGVGTAFVVIALGARFADEILSGLPDVLMPTIRSELDLSLTQVGLLGTVMSLVAAFVEPINGLLLDLVRRRRIMAFGAVCLGISVLTMGFAQSAGAMLLAFAIYGLGSGPLAHGGDVVLVEAHPEAPERITARATTVDTVGALLAPLAVAAAAWMGLGWRPLMVGAGVGAIMYAAAIMGTRFPEPAGWDERSGEAGATGEDGETNEARETIGADQTSETGGAGREASRRRGRVIERVQSRTELAATLSAMRRNLGEVMSHPRARVWLVFLLAFTVFEAPHTLQTVWLAEVVGLSQAAVGLYQALSLAASLAGLVWLERRLATRSARSLLITSTLALGVLYPLWILAPGVWPRVALAIPIGFLSSFHWPIGKARALASLPGRAGAVTAVHSLIGLAPLPLLVGALAERIGLTEAMLGVTMVGVVGMVWVAGRAS